ncbi:hypothetical protein [Flavipsychrobacter stenotrophus]|uniref:hypothetical protein n=1 Tax=Flavipsychrobacter stenotrophus TaxID=2077091 RepID=UPI001374A6F1|nr:hypothetical protein [Flavipsychrobacter stenotrophus]
MKYKLAKAIALLLIFSFLASCVSPRRTPWRRKRFNAHSNRGGGRYWYTRGS